VQRRQRKQTQDRPREASATDLFRFSIFALVVFLLQRGFVNSSFRDTLPFTTFRERIYEWFHRQDPVR
jgi:hypothetical protein